jgi:hypothetical protein
LAGWVHTAGAVITYAFAIVGLGSLVLLIACYAFMVCIGMPRAVRLDIAERAIRRILRIGKAPDAPPTSPPTNVRVIHPSARHEHIERDVLSLVLPMVRCPYRATGRYRLIDLFRSNRHRE